MKKNAVLLICLLLLNGVFGQENSGSRRYGEVILHLQNGILIDNFVKKINATTTERQSKFYSWETLSEEWNIHLLKFDENQWSAQQCLDYLRGHEELVEAQLNHRTTTRNTEPNDKDWWRQGDMTLIGMPRAWDAATGGLTPQNDTIVIAVLEKGADMNHPELIENRWYNWAEIPNNGKDDDGNGYIDDFRGWNPRTKNDEPGANSSHGNGVNGIIGARGNNLDGIAGVNWFVKLMNLGNVEYESEIIAAYNYVGKQRRIYNQTEGKKGAFVVATNASFGIDTAFPDDHKIWCAVYDSLGKLGILSVGATANANVNVDVEGDIPTACPSEFLIAVTNVTKSDQKVPGAGYGKISVDLGAPGTDTYTTTINNGYGTLGGTSAATPHVTGAIGLLYNLKCINFTIDALTNPVACVRRVRDVILSSVSPNPTLRDITSTGGRLNVAAAVDTVISLCGGSTGTMEILSMRPNFGSPAEVQVFYETPDYTTYTFRIYNSLGQLMMEEKVVPDPFGKKIWTFNPTNWSAGMYFVIMQKGPTKKIVEKFLKL